MDIGIKLKNRRKELDLTMLEVAKKVGVSEATVSRWESGDIANMRRDKIALLANALRVSPSYIMGWEETPEAKPNIQHTDIIPIRTKKVPLLGDIACGEPIMCNQEYDLYVDVAEDIHADFCVRAKGDSMINARIFNGDIVFCRNQPTVENGEIAVIIIDNEATLKRVYKYPNRIELRPENPTMRPIEYEGPELENVRILGKAIAFQSMVL